MNSPGLTMRLASFSLWLVLGAATLCIEASAAGSLSATPSGSQNGGTNMPQLPAGTPPVVRIFSRTMGSSSSSPGLPNPDGVWSDREMRTQTTTTIRYDIEYVYTAVWTVQANHDLRAVETFKMGSRPVENIDTIFPGNYGGFVYYDAQGAEQGIAPIKRERRYLHLTASEDGTTTYDPTGAVTGVTGDIRFKLREENVSATEPAGAPGTSANWSTVTEVELSGVAAHERLASWPSPLGRIGGVGDMGGVFIPSGFGGLSPAEYSSSEVPTTVPRRAEDDVRTWDAQNPFPESPGDMADIVPPLASFLSPTAKTKTFQKVQYTFVLTPASPAVINWLEIFTPKAAGQPKRYVFQSWTPAPEDLQSPLNTIDPLGLDPADANHAQRMPNRDGIWEVTLKVFDVHYDADNTTNEGYPDIAKGDLGSGEQNAQDSSDTQQYPGVRVYLNSGDVNSNGVVGYADGIDKFGNGHADANWKFEPFLIEVSSLGDFPNARFVFEYSASDPDQMTLEGTGIDAQYVLPLAKILRVWRKDGDLLRKPGSAHEGGDFISSGQPYTAQQLGWQSGDKYIKLFIEAVDLPSTDQTTSILINFEPAGSPGAANSTQATVKVEPFSVSHVNNTAPPIP